MAAKKTHHKTTTHKGPTPLQKLAKRVAKIEKTVAHKPAHKK